MKTLLLGLGKVNEAIARQIQGEKWAFVEDQDSTLISYSPEAAQSFRQIERVKQTFDDLDWEAYLPARVFISPGIDPRRDFFKKVRDYEVRELTFFCSRFKGKILGVTGTDGKSTFTFQLGEVLKRALPEKRIFVGGNLGIAMADALSGEWDIAVIEISSFQAERLRAARLDFAIILNLDTDHLDRYDSLEDYHRAKWGLLRFADDLAYPFDVKRPEEIPLAALSFSNHEAIRDILRQVVEHLAKGLSYEFRESLFDGLPILPHRMERWKDSEGRVFINDSKATTVHASLYGLRLAQKEFAEVRLILGGQYKGDDFRRFAGQLRKTDEILVCGEAREVILSQLEGSQMKAASFSSLKDLLMKTLPSIRPGTCLLLSPACSSYDEFDNFEERGKFFVNSVRALYAVSTATR